ncbi:MAG: hypothetical protein HY866_02535 [Chloroflexi bacterium]|nr:hypothetical protein [Chloroflexota bacterium]
MPSSKKQRARYLIGVISALIWMMLVLGLYYWVHKPLTPALAEAIGGALLDIGLAFLFALVAGGLGRRLLRIFKISFLSACERLAAEGLIGLSALSLLILGMGIFWLSRLSMIILFSVAAGLTFSDLSGWLRDLISFLRHGWPHSYWTRFLMSAALFMLALALILACLPPTKWDSLTYHLAGPSQYVEHGRFYGVPNNHFLGFPQLVNTLYAGQLALSGRLTGGAPIHWVIGVFMLMAAGGYVARRTGAAAGWLSVNILLTATTVWLEMTFAYVDLMAMGLAVVALMGAEQWQTAHHSVSESEQTLSEWVPRTNYLVLIGVCAGLGMSTKYTVLWMGIAFGCLVLWLGRRDGWLKSIQYGAIYGASAVLILAPWLVRNFIWYDNPFYPLAFESFQMDSIRQEWYSQPNSGLIYGPNAWQIFVLPVTATFLGVEGAGTYSTDIGPLFLILIPLLLLAWSYLSQEERTNIGHALFAAGTIFLIWLIASAFGSYISLFTRLVLYMFPLLAVVAAMVFESIQRLPKKPFDIGFVVQAMVGLTIVFTVVNAARFFADSRIQVYFSGNEAFEDDYLNEALGWHYATMQRINELPAGDTVRFLWEPRYLYCDDERIDCYTDSLMDAWYYARRSISDGSSTAIAAQWKDQNIAFLLVYEFGRKFECGKLCGSEEEGAKLYNDEDWQAWDQFVQDNLVEVWRNGNSSEETAYILYRWR